LAGCTTLLANYLAEPELAGGAFGGACVVSADGAMQASLALGREGMLVVDLG
jgi:hypothetical protein